MAVDPRLAALLLLVAGAGLAGFALGRRRPAALLACWLLVLCFVPIWVEVRLILPWSAAGSIAVLALLAYVSKGWPARWSIADLLMCFLFLWAIAPFFVGRLSFGSLAGVLTVWMVGYGLGRMAPSHVDLQWIYGAVGVAFTLVALLAIVEFLTGWHGLASWGPSNTSSATWQPIQVRGGLARAEGAFGHSIALGASLALALVLVVDSRFRPWIRVLMMMIMLLGIVVTLSRSALICAGLGMLLAMAFLRTPGAREVRRAMMAVAVVGAVVLVPLLLDVFQASDEAEVSASYRGDLLSLVPYFKVFGVSDALQISATGRVYFAGFRSIDSQLVLFGLSYGWATLVLVLLMLAMASLQTARGRAAVPTIAIVAQIPALATVALITQYHLFFWFVSGLAVAAEAAQGRQAATGSIPALSTRSLQGLESHR